MLLVIVAVLCAIIGVFLPFDLASQAREDRIYYQQFEQAARYLDRAGQAPAQVAVRIPRSQGENPSIHPVSMSASRCDDASFTKSASDRFVLSFWRGEWTECYAFPSGKTTLGLSLGSYLRLGWWKALAFSWLIVVVAAYGAVRLTRPLRLAHAASPNVS
ncbi:hypothetical protein [Sphingomonas psychrotolerans]|uniref:Uncharacterized protein n=1 Tax=Sphingomonas psychrotolerans TaxID=1327635 RepID=A0A2K8MDC3_9SPHN|nr:hypothetical protein [Sphingomonas psychrotolerans]ATY31888.1 hypothetical protein CVN68_07815 [Sphingomonas psychrotolerans]